MENTIVDTLLSGPALTVHIEAFSSAMNLELSHILRRPFHAYKKSIFAFVATGALTITIR